VLHIGIYTHTQPHHIRGCV